MALTRRKFLIGLGGAAVGLPFLEGLFPKKKHARIVDGPPPYALFYRRANGVQQALFNRNFSQEPERWFPNLPYGDITSAALAAPPSQPQGCALSELAGYASKLAIVRGLRHVVTGTLNGHREGFIQGLTGAGVKYPNDTPDTFVCDPLGESLDNRIARQLTPAEGKGSVRVLFSERDQIFARYTIGTYSLSRKFNAGSNIYVYRTAGTGNYSQSNSGTGITFNCGGSSVNCADDLLIIELATSGTVTFQNFSKPMSAAKPDSVTV